ncbi:MAG TPA: FmdB family zinc ribbon protein [Verrucomicrobiae bacterium]|nr:FmdB family zinc ribbon protein [Verrucomicrobiae bacterium]
MPTYAYVCAKCGHEFDKFQSMKDPALTICPQDACGQKRWGKGKVNRQLGTGAGLLFKGSGFYITDYRSPNYQQAAKKESASTTPAPAEKKTTGGEAKPAKSGAKQA